MTWKASQFLCFLFVFVFLIANTAQALGSSPVISQLKTGENLGLTKEYIAIYNNSDQAIDVTKWCINYYSASDLSKTKLACLLPAADNIRIMLSSFSYMRFSSNEFKATIPGFIPDSLFNSAMLATGGHIRLLDKNDKEVDKIGWGTAVSPETTIIAPHITGYLSVRKTISGTQFLQDINNNSLDFSDQLLTTIPVSGLYEEKILVDVCSNIDGIQTVVPDDYFLSGGLCIQDICDNLPDLQAEVPTGYESTDGENCTEKVIILESSILQITELLPNVSGSDTGKEFIEIYNPNNHAVDLDGYKFELGPSYSKNYVLKQQILEPFGFITFSDELTKLVLPNSTSLLRLIAPGGDKVSETDPYDSPKDDESWALIDDVWQFTNRTTPDEANLPAVVVTTPVIADEELIPCPAGKFRNPETNRCKNIETDNGLTPCAEGQERNTTTNRCRSIASADGLVPCKEGQERNPDTNRCRNILTNASASAPCDANQERNPDTNRCRKITTAGEVASAKVTDIPANSKSSNNLLGIGLVVTAIASYAIYEWRAEIRKLFSKKNFIKSKS